MMLDSFVQVRAAMLSQSMRICSICNTKHAATRRNRITKRNVVICCVEMLRLFGRDLIELVPMQSFFFGGGGGLIPLWLIFDMVTSSSCKMTG